MEWFIYCNQHLFPHQLCGCFIFYVKLQVDRLPLRLLYCLCDKRGDSRTITNIAMVTYNNSLSSKYLTKTPLNKLKGPRTGLFSGAASFLLQSLTIWVPTAEHLCCCCVLQKVTCRA